MNGTIMGVVLKPVGHKFCGVVASQDYDDDLEPVGDLEILWQGEPKPTPRSAQRDALQRYWGLYQFKHGFKHPDDPSRTADDPEPTMNVLVQLSGDDL